MTRARPPAPTMPAVGPATCAAAAELATRAADLLEPHAVMTEDATPPSERKYHAASDADRAEAARLLRAAADLVSPPTPPDPVLREASRSLLDLTSGSERSGSPVRPAPPRPSPADLAARTTRGATS